MPAHFATNQQEKALNKARRYFVAVVIVVFAAGVAWWSSRTEARVSTHIKEEVSKLVPRFPSSPSIISSVVIDPVLEPLLATYLEFVYINSIDNNVGYDVVVTSGDNEEYGDGTATHIAVFQINKKSVAGLRIICSSDTDPLKIAGIFPSDWLEAEAK